MVVYEDDRIVYVGHRFDGQADRTIDARGKLVSPGFIDCHLHLGSNASHVYLTDRTKADYFGSNFIGYYGARRGAPPPALNSVEVEQRYGIWAAVRGGATTLMDVAPQLA